MKTGRICKHNDDLNRLCPKITPNPQSLVSWFLFFVLWCGWGWGFFSFPSPPLPFYLFGVEPAFLR